MSTKENQEQELNQEELNQEASAEASTEENTEETNTETAEDTSEVAEENTLEQELGEAKDKYLRLYSEFENFRRRTSKEKLDLISTANKDLMADILPSLDDFDRALQSTDDAEAFLEGIKLIHQKLNKTLENRGLKKMEIEKGAAFDEEVHEAITQIPAGEDMEGKVVDVVEAGYTLGEKVVRFAKVVVGAKQ